MGKVTKKVLSENIDGITYFWPAGLPAFRLSVPDSGKGIFMGSATVLDAFCAEEMSDALLAAAKHFREKYPGPKGKV